MKGKLLTVVLSVVFFAPLVYCEEPKVFTDSDLEDIKQAPITDDESMRSREPKVTVFEEQREPEHRQQPSLEDQKKVEKETRAVWENMKKALSGKQETNK